MTGTRPPDDHLSVISAGDQRLPRGAECHRLDGLGVPGQDVQLYASGGAPEDHLVIRPRRCESTAVRAEGDSIDLAGVTPEDTSGRPGLDPPDGVRPAPTGPRHAPA